MYTLEEKVVVQMDAKKVEGSKGMVLYMHISTGGEFVKEKVELKNFAELQKGLYPLLLKKMEYLVLDGSVIFKVEGERLLVVKGKVKYEVPRNEIEKLLEELRRAEKLREVEEWTGFPARDTGHSIIIYHDAVTTRGEQIQITLCDQYAVVTEAPHHVLEDLEITDLGRRIFPLHVLEMLQEAQGKMKELKIVNQ